MKQQLRALAAAALLAVMLGNPNAFADDGKSYAGASCQPVSRADVDSIAYYSGIAWNTSTTHNLVLHCPIIRDTPDGIAGGGVAVWNRNIDGIVDCTMRSFNDRGGIVAESWDTAGWDPSVQHLAFSAVGAPGRFGYYTLECVVPPAVTATPAGAGWSGIVLYWVEER